jgi:beta-aspartyl-peptidase (threonine type)
MKRGVLICWAVLVLAGCGQRNGLPHERDVPPGPRLEWALAIHGGAGSTPSGAAAERRQAALERLDQALRAGKQLLEAGGSSLDTVERVVRILEDDPLFNAGKGAVFNADGRHELDASIMDGATLACGGVAGVGTVKNPISLSRLVMERTPHVLLAGEGAERFADRMQVERVPQEYFFTETRWEALQRSRRKASRENEQGTVGAVALDRHGNLAAATSTGGLTNKMSGRVGDSPVIGAGTYADNATCAVSGTGKGEEFIRHSVAYSISALMADRDLSVRQAAERIVTGRLQAGEGGVIALAADGSIAMVFNTEAMYRAAADSGGRYEVAIGP